MAKILQMTQLKQKRHEYLDDLPQEITRSFGCLPANFIMIVWGKSGQGKTNLLMQFLKSIAPFGKLLYVSLEEGFELSFQNTVMRHLREYDSGILFADHSMTFDELMITLARKGSPQFIIIDSLQYWCIRYSQYKTLKETYPSKTFIFTSHAAGRDPSGKTAIDIRYDAGVKVFVEGYVAFVTSRFQTDGEISFPYVIWETGAKKYWKRDYRKVINGDLNPFRQ